MSVSSALHRCITEIRETYGYDNPLWTEVCDRLAVAYVDALYDERDAAA